jgi:uncharacterized membrane protein (DUF441 family)
MTSLSRIAALIASFLVGWAATKGLTLDPLEITAIVLGVFQLVHVLVSKKTNPTNATGTVEKSVLENTVSHTAEYKASRVDH